VNFSGSYLFKEKIDEVWSNLNDPEILKASIHGCKEFTEKEKNIFFLKIQVKIGPVNATFSGELKIKETNPPLSYIIEASANAGQLGGGSGVVEIRLKEKDSSTNLIYEATTKINGKIAQLGARLIEGTVKKNTALFFNNFENLLDKKKLSSDEEIILKNKVKENGAALNNFNKKYLYFSFVIIILFIVIIIVGYE
tara:strand:+ start:780 stop:1367 length:588 start_codon:yes stop_codon:yes gene_type:complete